MINFLAEISKREKITIHATPSSRVSRQYNIYEIDISNPPESSYWTDWGGHYDNYTGNDIELFFTEYLKHLPTLDDVKENTFSLCILDNVVYFNIPSHPWTYGGYTQGGYKIYPFLYAALNPDKPSNKIINGVKAETRLELPNFTVKLSEEISGISLNQGFSIQLKNDDGYFDKDKDWLLHNTPVTIKKAVVENPEYHNFIPIRDGLVENIETTFAEYSIDVADKLAALENEVCDVIKADSFPSVSNLEIDESVIGKKIPIVFGTKRIEPIKLADKYYLLAEYVEDIIGVYDKDGNELAFQTHFYDRIISNVTDVDYTEKKMEPDYAIIAGYRYSGKNKVGSIITYLLENKSGIIFNDTYWNTKETLSYIYNSPAINIVISSGNVKKVIQDVLKNDTAYLIQQNSGKFTIREWGNEIEYATHKIPAWCITKTPKKDYSAAYENYFSSCVIQYSNETGDNIIEFQYDDNKEAAISRYSREKVKIFKTDIALLMYVNTHVGIAAKLGKRYSTMRQTLEVAVGIDTSGFELLDRVQIDLNINGRQFSEARNFVIKGINPAQDILTLEEIEI